jgi:hypothetical protein
MVGEINYKTFLKIRIMKSIKYFSLLIIAVLVFVSCKKDGFGPLTDARPDIPVNVANATEYRPGPTVTVSRATPAFNIILEIPSSSGRSIKEITKVAATAGSSTPLFGTTGLYNTAPIAGSGNKVTFSTTLAEFTAKTGRAVPANNPPLNAIELDRQFYFLVTLDNGQEIITQQVRVLVVP